MEIEITDYGYNGEGVAKFKGKVCFVPYTLLGEKLVAIIEKENSSFCRCKTEKFLTKSEERVFPPCPYFSVCGGCDFQHTNYQNELQIKKQILQNHLSKIGYSGQITVIKSPKEYFYRNKIKLFCKNNDLALSQAFSKKLVPIKKCQLVGEEINAAIEKIQNFVKAKNIGNKIKEITIRKQGDNVLVCFDMFKKPKLDFEGLQIMLGAKCGLFYSVNGSKAVYISGVERLKEKLFGLDCSYSVQDFHQVNDQVGELLYKTVIDECRGEKIINCYSGAGVLSGILAKNKKCVYGIELGLSEHQSAQKLKEANGLDNLFNIQGDCAKHLPKLISEDATVILDPPRAGVDLEVCNAIERARPKRVLYISCNPATLVRDLARLKSYNLDAVTLFDMFAKTSSMEVLCCLSKKTD